MKTLLVTSFLAVVMAACSSDNTPSLTTSTLQSVPQGGACTSSADCEAPLDCAFPANPDGGSCPATGTCVAMGPCSYVTVCPCRGDAGGPVQACVSQTFTTVPGKACGTTTVADAATGG
jgi:hypothetical protein